MRSSLKIVTLAASLLSAAAVGGGSAVAHPAGPALLKPTDIAAGPDGNMWFTERHRIGRITPAGVITEFSEGIFLPFGSSGIAAGPDGNLWFTEPVGDRIGGSSRRCRC